MGASLGKKLHSLSGFSADLLYFLQIISFHRYDLSWCCCEAIFVQSSWILRLNQELMSSSASLRTAGNSRKSWEQRITRSETSPSLATKNNITSSSSVVNLVGSSWIELDALVVRSAEPEQQIITEFGPNRMIMMMEKKMMTKVAKMIITCTIRWLWQRWRPRWQRHKDHLYKSSDPIGLQSLSPEPWRARNGVLDQNKTKIGNDNYYDEDYCYNLTSPSFSMLSPMATTKA